MQQIQFLNVTKKYKPGIVAIQDITFSIDKGEFVFITGPSGAGKSTILRLLIKQETPNEGEIFFEKIAVPKIPDIMLPLYRQQIGMVFQDLKLIQNKTAEENVEFAIEIGVNNKLDKKARQELIDYLFDLVNLQNRRDLFPAQLSGGEKQKVAIARALANNPKVIAADEPTGNLDPDSAKEIVEILSKINQTGTTVLVISHDMEIVKTTAARHIKMKSGRIIEDSKSPQRQKRVKKREAIKKKEAKGHDIQELKLNTKIINKLRLTDMNTIEEILELTPKELEDKGLTHREVKRILHSIKLFFKDKKNET